ncbi:MAG: hypothetical protein M3478_01615, partial [Planctomycetota bacterium]|nr:hypothetical protein [Planctomycetota bacterium]
QANASPAIPKGAQWTIHCREIGGPDHVSQARQLKDNLVKNSGMRDWHLLHRDEGSVLFYGYYKTHTDARAKADRQKIDSMADVQGRRPFRHALVMPLEAADPAGPPEWNLANAKGYFTLQIGVYKDSPERKQYAVDAVRAARQQGIEAYYYHSENMSLVCVGAWPREAIRLADEDVRPGDEGEIKVVLPPLPPDVKAPQLRGEGGRKLHVEAGRNEVLDPTLKAMMENQFPTMAVNGATMVTKRTDPRTGRVQEVIDPSFPIKIPRRDAGLLHDGGGIPIPPSDGLLIDSTNSTTPSRVNSGVRGPTNGS